MIEMAAYENHPTIAQQHQDEEQVVVDCLGQVRSETSQKNRPSTRAVSLLL